MDDFTAALAEIQDKLDGYRKQNLRMFATSSFQTNSVVLLHILSTIAPDVPVYFLNTGFHFPETLMFRDDLRSRLGLDVRDVFSSIPRHQQRVGAGRFLFTSDPDTCCHINKIASLEPVLQSHDVWINGIRAGQSATRQAMKRQQRARGVLRFHPILKWSEQMVADYILRHDLPRHPLDSAGYGSVGCRPCTRRPSASSALDDRGGRWAGLNKTECGLHTVLATPDAS